MGQFNIVFEQSGVERLHIGQRMRPGKQYRVIIFPNQLKVQLLFIQVIKEMRLVLDAIADDAQPEAAGEDIVDRLYGVGFLDAQSHVHLRIERLNKARHAVGNVAAARHGQAQALHIAGLVVAQGFHLLHLQKHTTGQLEEFLAAAGGHDAARRALKHRKAQVFFQFADGLAEVGLRHIEIFRRLRDRAGALHFNGVLKLDDIHGSPPFRFLLYRAGARGSTKIGRGGAWPLPS